MKLAYPVLTEETVKPLLGFKGDTKQILAQLAEIGYSGVELLVRNPEEIDIVGISRLLQQLNLQVAAVGTGPVVSDDQMTFTDGNAETRAMAVKRAKKIVEFTAQFDSIVSIGKLRGEIDDKHSEQSWLWMREGLEQVCEVAEKLGVKVALEPQSHLAMNNLNTTSSALLFAESLQLPNLNLMLDTYHMEVEGEFDKASFEQAREWMIYLHVADSDRLAPGKGRFHFEELIQTLQSISYKGFITPEIDQKHDSYYTAKEAFEFLREKIELARTPAENI
ncbi:sugar phosphate isomerase/epimerase family protein [Sporosarcina sp. FSL W7-1349]|uniref:sugar phosphate isomerase/epimerase family protein n=1 Tax=Sporosarcina sp. FSL W7-1349 TaxID=2921561 RepID=UPI0030F9CDD6